MSEEKDLKNDSIEIENIIEVEDKNKKVKVKPIVVIIVCSAHRGEGYDASSYAIERLKELVPIWKQEIVNGEKGKWVEMH